ncbi:UPF0046 protein K07C11.7 [Diplonema papillatum]|nr:UPF0046 protein K07C11.7 [Diplonema papillatum]
MAALPKLAAGLVASAAAYLVCRACSRRPRRAALGIRVVCISDTHGKHRDMTIPPGDVLIHGGDSTHFGKKSDIVDLNAWLAELPHAYKIVIDGNHEANADWKHQTSNLLQNATFLRNGATQLHIVKDGVHRTVKIFGCKFSWPVTAGSISPYYLPEDADIVVNHVPPKGRNDGGEGCALFSQAIEQVPRLRLVVGGHVHSAHGRSESGGVVYVNAANCRDGYSIGWDPVVVDI